MYKQTIKIHKGISNNLKFRVFDPDKCPVNINNMSIRARLVYTETNQSVIEKLCQKGSIAGIFTLLLDENEISHLLTGFYTVVFTAQVDNGVFYPLYVDYNNNIQLVVELTSQGQRDPIPDTVIDRWTQVSTAKYGPMITSYESSNIPSASMLNLLGDQCTFSVTTQGFTGTLQVYGTLSHSPNQSLDEWYKVELRPTKNTIEFVNFTGTDYFTFNERSMWYKFVYTPDTLVVDPGTFQKVIVRV